MAIPGLVLVTLYRRKEIFDMDIIFMEKYGSFFQEFHKESGEIKCLFYVVFFTRRLCMIVLFLFFDDKPLAQLIIFSCFCLGVIGN